MIKIYKNPNGDTRTAPKNVSYKEFQRANDMHRQDIENVMNEIAYEIMIKGREHDWTKKADEELFYNEFKDTIENGSNFVEGKWYKGHVRIEKHHLFSNCHDDITLLDVIEMIVDCVCAGKARSGKVSDLELSNEILQLAFNNTVKFVDNMTKLDELE